MTSSSGIQPLRSGCHGTPGCLLVPDSTAAIHAVVPGDAAKDGGTKSALDMSEANATGESPESELILMQNNRIFVLDIKRQPLMPCHPARAR